MNIDKLIKLQTEKRLDPNYTNIERDALKNGFTYKKKKKPKKNRKQTPHIRVPKVERIAYKLFLKTKYWEYVKKLVLDRDKKQCTHCGNKWLLHVHHLTYDHHFSEHKHLEDLTTLCYKCHKLVHEIS